MTRPEPGATATAARLEALGHEPVLAPCLTIRPRRAALPEQPAAIIVTSLQAIPALPARYRGLPVFCVGDATAGRLRQAGFCSAMSAGGNADDLFNLLARRHLPGLHLLTVGERHGLALARRLRRQGVEVERRAVYTAAPVRELAENVRLLLATGGLDAALFYSAATARAFARMAPPGTGTLAALALSPAVAAALGGLPWADIRVAVAPTEADLLALL